MSRVTRRQYRLQSWRAPACARTSLAVAAELFRVDSVAGRRERPCPRPPRGRRRDADLGGPGEPGNPDTSAAATAPAGSENTAMSMLELRQVSRSYGQGSAEAHALRDVSLTADEGAMVAVMGPSGSGKSTLLTIAGTLEDPTSGEVLIGGELARNLSRGAKARLRRRVIGYVFQDFNLLPGLTAAENVSLPLELDGVPGRKARAAALNALDRLGLSGRASHYPDQMSGGERQRVAIGRAMVGDRKLLLADEPSGALDSVNAEAVMRLLHDAYKNAGMTAVVVTHDAQLACWADRMVFLRDGRVTNQSAPAPGPESRRIREGNQ
ncbi:MAG TPA: ABC transporter ATP-binding protein [Trebonia sp.]